MSEQPRHQGDTAGESVDVQPATPTAGDTASTEDRRPRRWGCLPGWALALLGLLGLLCVSIAILGTVFGPGLVRRGVEATRAVGAPVTGYYDAVKAKDWRRAHTYLSRELGGENSPQELEAAWRRRSAAYGDMDSFDIEGTQVRTATGSGTTATVSGTLRYEGGQEERKILTLTREGGEWKLTTLP